jgi:uncharacterized protein YjdB
MTLAQTVVSHARSSRRALLLATLAALACMGQEVKVTGPGRLGGGASDTTPRTLFFSISPTLATIAVGASQQLSSRLQDASGNLIPGQPVTWGSTNTGVASVDGTGVVTGVGPGTTTISASSMGQGANASITVDPVPVASVAVAPRFDTLQVGFTGQLTATPHDAIGTLLTGRIVSWASDNPAVATVNGGGLVRAVAVGTANVTATIEGVVGSSAITVLFIPVASVQVTPAQDSTPLGGSRTFTATPRDALGNPLTGRAVAWGTNDPAVATVSNGIVTGTGVGTTTITATSEGQTGSATVKVILMPVATVQVTPATASVVVGQTRQLTATTREASGGTLTGRVVTWASGNPAAATVDGAGLVTAVAAGSAVITATSEGKNGTATITVTNAPPTLVRVILTPNPTSVLVGQTRQFSVSGKFSDSTTAPVTATYAATGGTINSGGLYTAGQASGAFRAIATSAGKADTSAITVIRPSVASVVVTPALDTVAVLGTRQLTAVPKDSVNNTLTGRVCTWSSVSPATATVNGSGLVTGVVAGTATITATCEGVSGTNTTAVIVILAATVQVTPASSGTTVGNSTQLSATARDRNGIVLTGHPVTWVSLSPLVATVSPTGLVRGLTLGTATIQATVDTAKGIAAVRVDTVSASVPWIEEDFARYLTTLDFLADPRGIYSVAEDNGANQITLDRTVGVPALGLSQSMRYDYNAPGCSSQTVGRNLALPSNVTEIWIEVYLKWSSNFNTFAAPGGCATPPAHKLLFARVGPGLYGRWEIEWGNQGPPQAIYWGYPSSGGGVQDQFGFDGAPAYWNNTWYQVRWHFKNSSSSSASDGAFEMWVDGQLKASRANIRIDVSSYIYGIALGRNLDQGIRSGTMSLWWGRIRVWKLNPGWP